MKITGSTTLAELSAYLTTLGNPFITLIKSHPDAPHSRHAIAYVAGVGSFDGDGDTEAEALEAALAALRRAAGITNLEYEPLNYVRDRDRGLGILEELRYDTISLPPQPSRIGVSLAEQTKRVMDTLTPREREVLAQRLETSQRTKQDPAYNKFRQTSDEVPERTIGRTKSDIEAERRTQELERDIARGKAADNELRRQAAKLCHGCRHVPADHPNDSGCQKWHDEGAQ